MAFESFYSKYRPLDIKVYSLGDNWDRKPELLKPTLQSNINSALNRLNGDGDFTAVFSFRVPDQSHVLPLFQNILFNSMIDFHNKK